MCTCKAMAQQVQHASSDHTPQAVEQQHTCTAIVYNPTSAHGVVPCWLLPQEMDSWHNEGMVLPQFQLDCYAALLGMATILDAADWLQMHGAEGSSAEAMGVSAARHHVGTCRSSVGWQSCCAMPWIT